MVNVWFDNISVDVLNDSELKYLADITSFNDYYPFGSLMPGRSYQSNSYRFGFNGKEKDDVFDGVTGSKLDFGARIYDSRVARFLSLDPRMKEFPYWTPYCFAANNPIKWIDVNGEGPGDLFDSPDEAAEDWAMTYNDNSIEDNKEYSSVIFKVDTDEGLKYTYTAPNVGEMDEVTTNKGDTKRKDRVADIHSHGACKEDLDNTDGYYRTLPLKDANNIFSYEDEMSIPRKMSIYLANPNGELLNYDPKL